MNATFSAAIKNLQALHPDEIRRRLSELGEEEKALRVLLRSRLAAEKIKKREEAAR